MPVFETQRLGSITYDPESTIEFPRGLPGFDDRRAFVAVHVPGADPLVFLQSLEDPGLCFITAPVQAIDPAYRLEVGEEDLALVGLPVSRRPAIGREALCLVVLSVRESGPTANLLGPLLINLRNRKAVQAVSVAPGYSHQHALEPEAESVCS
jgi:flagellar assembly factor FliW